MPPSRNLVTRRLAVVAAVASVIVGCAGDGPDHGTDSAVPARGPGELVASTVAVPPLADSSSPSDTLLGGRDWNMAKLVKRLESAGLAPVRLPTAIRHSFLSIPGTTFQIGGAELQVFIYPDSLSAARDVSR